MPSHTRRDHRAYSDEAGHAFQLEIGRVYRGEVDLSEKLYPVGGRRVVHAPARVAFT